MHHHPERSYSLFYSSSYIKLSRIFRRAKKYAMLLHLHSGLVLSLWSIALFNVITTHWWVGNEFRSSLLGASSTGLIFGAAAGRWFRVRVWYKGGAEELERLTIGWRPKKAIRITAMPMTMTMSNMNVVISKYEKCIAWTLGSYKEFCVMKRSMYFDYP